MLSKAELKQRSTGWHFIQSAQILHQIHRIICALWSIICENLLSTEKNKKKNSEEHQHCAIQCNKRWHSRILRQTIFQNRISRVNWTAATTTKKMVGFVQKKREWKKQLIVVASIECVCVWICSGLCYMIHLEMVFFFFSQHHWIVLLFGIIFSPK